MDIVDNTIILKYNHIYPSNLLPTPLITPLLLPLFLQYTCQWENTYNLYHICTYTSMVASSST